jgi:hypothetical protein
MVTAPTRAPATNCQTPTCTMAPQMRSVASTCPNTGNSPFPRVVNRHMAVTVLSFCGADSAFRRGKHISDDEFLNPGSAQAGHAVMMSFMLALCFIVPCRGR